MSRYDLPDFEWRAIEALLQPHRFHTSPQLILTRSSTAATGTHRLSLMSDHSLDDRDRLSCLFGKADERPAEVVEPHAGLPQSRQDFIDPKATAVGGESPDDPL